MDSRFRGNDENGSVTFYEFVNTECPIFKQIMDMIYYNNDLTTQLLNHLTRSVSQPAQEIFDYEHAHSISFIRRLFLNINLIAA
jgi:hypothetical protein